MKTMYTGLLVLVINLGTTLALTTIDKRLEFNSATKEATLIGVTMLISYAAMVAGRRILPSLIGHGKQGVQDPVPPAAGSPEDEPPECLKQQLRDIQERMEYNALIATAAASDDIANMHKVLRRMLELDASPTRSHSSTSSGLFCGKFVSAKSSRMMQLSRPTHSCSSSRPAKCNRTCTLSSC